ncbi:ABC transporter substrate-binding protein [Natrialbaceae archaeon A-CW1-1]
MTTDDTRVYSRRNYLQGVGGAVAAGTAGLAGCLGSDLEELTLAYMPIYPDLQYFVMDGEGYLDELSVDVDAREFTDGPAIVQAYGGGEIDVAMFGIVPSMIVIDRGIPAKVTAANITEPMAIMAHDDFQQLWADHGADAFERWTDERGTPFRFGTFPQGSVPDVLLRYWLETDVGLEPEEATEIIEINGASAVWQAIANDEIDGTSIMEPVPTIAQEEESSVSTFLTAAEIMPGQPAAVTLMSDEVRESEVAREFLEQHRRATEFINDNPGETAEHVSEGIGMPLERAQQALESPLSNFVTDPREIENGTEIFAEFTHRNGQTDDYLEVEDIFDTSVYDEVA